MSETIGDHAVVLGGSMAGVVAARVLADRYARVTVVDRDRFPAVGMRRRGVPQDRHIHALQTRGKRAIETLFPGVTQELVDQGAVTGDWGRTATHCFAGNRFLPVDAGLELLAVSRPLLEGHLRTRLGQLDGVAFLEACDVHGLVRSGDRITAARILRQQDGQAEELLHADLVVDATGRASRLPRWLEDMGFPTPEADETGLDVAYTSCRYPRRPTDDKQVIIISSVAPDGRRGGGAIAAEGDSWVVTLAGVLGEAAPTDPEGFVEYAATLVFPDLHELIRDREPLSDPVLMRFPTSRRLRYEQLTHFPDNLIVLGDALCSFNPAYGQGMTVAAAEALILGDCLDTGEVGIGQRFLAAVDELVSDAWGIVAGRDAAYVSDPADRPPLPARVLAAYRRRVLQAAAEDPVVARSFLRVMAMVARPPSLLDPRLVARVLWRTWRAPTGDGDDPAHDPQRAEGAVGVTRP